MGADLFGSFAESTCAALVISSVSTLGTEHVYVAMCYPLLISAVGILVCLLTTLIATDLKPARGINDIQSTLKWQLVIATVLATPVSALPLTPCLPCLPPNAASSACLQCMGVNVLAIPTVQATLVCVFQLTSCIQGRLLSAFEASHLDFC